MSIPSNVNADGFNNVLVMEWFKKNIKTMDVLSISFFGNQKVHIEASYPEMDIKIANEFPLNEDMANFVTTHLNNFKQPLKKKRYK